MTFLTPALLLGAALVALPIVLHLARRREPRRMAFPALRLLEKTRKKQETHLRLRRLLLLALRCLAIALLALAVARPVLTPASGSAGALASGEAATGLVLAMVFDNGPNMGYRQSGQTRLEAALDVAEWMLGQTPAETQVVLADRTRGSRPRVADAVVTLASLERLSTSPATRPIDSAIAEALRTLAETSAGRREAYVFTDLSTGAWSEATQSSVTRLLEEYPDLRLRLVDVGAGQVSNAGVATLELSAETLLVGEPLGVRAVLRAVGPPPRDAVARLWIDDEDGKPIKRDERPIAFADGETTTTIDFALRGLPEGSHTGRVQLVTADGLPADDTRYFAARVRRPPSVWLVAPSDTQAVFVRSAIARTETAPGVECETLLMSEFARDRQLARLDPSQTAAVLLLDPPPLRGAAWRRLADYVTAGGGVGVFLGREATLESLNNAEAQSVLPATFRWRSRERTYLSPADYASGPLAPLAPFAEALSWAAFPVLQRWDADRVAEDARVIAPYADGGPAIIARTIGRGRVLLMTTPLSDPLSGARRPWNLLPTGEDPWPFLLLAQAMTDHLASAPTPPLIYNAGQTATTPLASDAASSGYLVRLPSGESVRQTAVAGAETLAVRLTDEPGPYRVASGGALEERFVVNVHEDAGDLTRVDAAALVASLGEDRVEIVRDRRALESSIDRGRVGRELYGWVLAIVVAVFAGEQVVSNRFYRRSAEDAA
ncbi:MAG: BatA domain-containing protein [Planctomycetota bacterium]